MGATSGLRGFAELDVPITVERGGMFLGIYAHGVIQFLNRTAVNT